MESGEGFTYLDDSVTNMSSQDTLHMFTIYIIKLINIRNDIIKLISFELKASGILPSKNSQWNVLIRSPTTTLW